MIETHDAAIAGIAFLVFTIALLVIGIIVASRRWAQQRTENRRELNQARAGIDAARGLSLEATRGMDMEMTRQLVWSHRARPRRRHAR